MSEINISLKLFNGDLLNYVADTIIDPSDGVRKARLVDHIKNIRELVLNHLNLDKNYIIRFLHPNEEDEMLSLYFKKYEKDQKDYIKNKLLDKKSYIYFLMYKELLKEKIYTKNVILDVFVDDNFKKDCSDEFHKHVKCLIM